MTTNDNSPGDDIRSTPYGKIMGILDDRDQLQSVSTALLKLGVNEIEVLSVAAETEVFGTEKDASLKFFLGDMEAEMAKRFVHAQEAGRLIFAAVVEPEKAEAAAKTAKAHGASDVAYFGEWVITNY